MRLLFLILFFFPFCAQSQEAVDSAFIAGVDSLLLAEERKEAVRKVIRDFEARRLLSEQRFDHDGLFPLLRSAVMLSTEKRFVDRPGFVPQKDKRFTYTDYAVAGLPLATAWIMKAAGVKSRSTTARMASASALSLALSSGITSCVKALADERRPDGSDCHSMPSGHSAFAFVSATILAREYGDVSPWIGVGAYTAACATQYLRLRHSRHWASDIHMGAGIGMLSTSLGYLLTDKLIVRDGIMAKPEIRLRDMQRVATFNNRPSGLSIVSGSEFGERTFRISDTAVNVQTSFTVGAELSVFANQLFAVELMARSSAGYAKVCGQAQDGVCHSADNFLMHHVDIAGKYSFPFVLGKRVNARAFAGLRHVAALRFVPEGVPCEGGGAQGVAELAMPAATSCEAGCGLGYEAIDRKNYAAGLACDYIHSFGGVMRNRYNFSTFWRVLF